MAGSVRVVHLTAEETSRDLLGIVRGKCTGPGCSCGKYLIRTKEKYYRSTVIEEGSSQKKKERHPDNDLSILNCSRCGCANEAHLENRHETEREWGNDAFALQEWDTAIRHYTKSIEECQVDAKNWSNRSACYAKKGWYEQALYDAEHACSLQPEWYKVWYRKSVAYMGLRRYEEAGKAGREGLKYAQGESEVGMLRQLVKKADEALLSVKRRKKENAMSGSKGGSDIGKAATNGTIRNGGMQVKKDNMNYHGKTSTSYNNNNNNKESHEINKSELCANRQHAMVLDEIREDVSSMKKKLDSLTAAVCGLQSTMQQFMERGRCGEKIKATYVQEKEAIDIIHDDHKNVNCDEEGLIDECEHGQQEDVIINHQQRDMEQEQEENEQECNEKEQDGRSTVAVSDDDDDDDDDTSDTNGDNIQNEIESMEAAWKDVVQDARALLGFKGNGFVPPPVKRKKSERKPPSFKKDQAKLSIDSLGSLFVDLKMSKKSNVDPTGIERFACSACDNECAGYLNPNLNPSKERILIPNALQNSCDSCGCHFAQHTVSPKIYGEDATQSDGSIEVEATKKEEASQEKASVSRVNSSSPESRIDIERKRRILSAIERKELAERNGELIVETNADILSQKERLTCTSCTECPGFKIIYHTSDANNPDIMFYCSLCGCPSDDHLVDQTWQAAETRRKQAEEAQAAARAARQRQWNRSRPNMNQSSYDVLNVPFGSSKSVIARAYKKAALQYHPDKQPRTLSYGELLKRQDKFHQITAAYRSLTD
eukprot:jgi/Picsp_1/1370/NSC_04849-R1_heat shock protein sti-like